MSSKRKYGVVSEAANSDLIVLPANSIEAPIE
jgi:hypothetical protein